MILKESFDIYSKNDIFFCCHRVLSFERLKVNEGPELINPKGGVWRTVYYCCPVCNRVLVYDRADGIHPLEVVGAPFSYIEGNLVCWFALN